MSQGNRPDCAYFLVIGLTLAGFLITVGGVFSYVAYWPEVALQESPTQHHLHQRHRYGTVALKGVETKKIIEDEKLSPLLILGPLFLSVGGILLLVVIILGIRYKCDYEPEPNVAFLRLQSQWSLNMEPNDGNKYELMAPNRPSGLRNPAPTQIV